MISKNGWKRMLSLKNDAQKGVKHVYLGMGADRFRLVGILITGIFYLFVYEKLKQRVQKQKVGDPIS